MEARILRSAMLVQLFSSKPAGGKKVMVVFMEMKEKKTCNDIWMKMTDSLFFLYKSFSLKVTLKATCDVRPSLPPRRASRLI